jgi:hypothetical protein
MIFTYSAKLYWYSLSVDANCYIASPQSINNLVSIGRWGVALIQKIWHIQELNPFTYFFTACCFLLLSTLAWCYIIAIFSQNTKNNPKLIPFALLFITTPVWAEQFNWLLQTAPTAFSVFLCPYSIYLLYKGLLDKEKWKVASAWFLLVLVISIYQSNLILICCGILSGILICFLLLLENSHYKPAAYYKLVWQISLWLLTGLASYFLIVKIISVCQGINIYTEEHILFGQISFREHLLNILGYIYILTIGNLPLAQQVVVSLTRDWLNPAILARLFEKTRLTANVLLLPATILFLAQAFANRRIKHPQKLLYICASLGIPLSIFSISLLTGGTMPYRSLFALPLALSFMLYTLSLKYNKFWANTVMVCMLLVAIHQAQISALLFYSDYIRYQDDVRLAYFLQQDIAKTLAQYQQTDEQLALAIIGAHHTPMRKNYLRGEAMGLSYFDPNISLVNRAASMNFFESLPLSLPFLQSLGFNYELPSTEQMSLARAAALKMPNYPAAGSVLYQSNEKMIIIKLSDSVFR